MCGICGGLSWQNPLEEGTLRAMLAKLVHRGPDDEGVYLASPVALGARRLSIIDIESGHQPISNEDGSVWVAQNGEIYNYLELSVELKKRGHLFKTNCDTEVLAHLYEEYGDKFVDHLVGMFAIAIWDAREEKLLLVRDRLGQKPLYYIDAPEGLFFASEIKALKASGHFNATLDYTAVSEYLFKLYAGGGRTFFSEVQQLLPGHLLIAGRNGCRRQQYWSPWGIKSRQNLPNEGQLLDELQSLLQEAVDIRMRSDVPLGCFLSGGIDSSLIAALAVRKTTALKTFSISFSNSQLDESHFARQVADHLKTDHQEFRVQGLEEEVLSRLPHMFDQPFGDSSAVPTWYVSKMTRSQVTVALSGDGGDEVFGGYRRYYARKMAQRWNRWPGFLRRMLKAVANLPGGSNSLRRFLAFSEQILKYPEFTRQIYFDQKMQKGILLPEVWEKVVEAVTSSSTSCPPSSEWPDQVDYAMRRDLVDYLPGDILTKVDRTSMDVSLEVRSPYLDHRVVEFMLALPVDMKLRGKTGKYLLKRLAERYLPADIVHRKKQGFAVMLADIPFPEEERTEEASMLEQLTGSANIEELLAKVDPGSGHGGPGELSWALNMLLRHEACL
jgi:asparagine synthase (glutamine-hydrolysing)